MLNIPQRNSVLVTVEVISGEPAYGMLFSVPDSPGIWKHVGNPHVSFDSGADPDREKIFIALQPVGAPGQLSMNMHLIELTS
jgi:hypothetical protein